MEVKRWFLILDKDGRHLGVVHDDEKLAEEQRRDCQARWPERGPWRVLPVVPEAAP